MLLSLSVQRNRAVSSEISGNLLITYVNRLFLSPALQSDAVK